jgi:Sugar (and other) transporter
VNRFVSQMIVASAGTAFPGSTNMSAQKALVAFVCIYIFFFACSWGPVACKFTSAHRLRSLSACSSNQKLTSFLKGWLLEKFSLSVSVLKAFP